MSNNLITVYYADYSDAIRPVPVQCEKPGYPNCTVDGDVMYANTHYLNERDAWDHIMRNLKAGLELRTHDYRESKRRLAEAEKRVVKAAEELQIGEERYLDFLESVES